MEDLKFAILGAGFWAPYQLAAWQEVKGAKCIAIFDRNHAKAKKLADKFNIPAYKNAGELLENEQLDFIDIITSDDTHAKYIKRAADHNLNIICQKPLAPNFKTAKELADYCSKKSVKLYVHENYRWQAPMRKIKNLMKRDTIGQPVRARMTIITGQDDFANQPFLKKRKRLLLNDLGTHVLDVIRFLFGEALSLWCEIKQIQADIEGEDMGSIMLKMQTGIIVYCEMSVARIAVEPDNYLEPLLFIEGTKGSINLNAGCNIQITTKNGTEHQTAFPENYAWANPDYMLSMASMVDCHKNLLEGLKGNRNPETDSADNIKTLQLVDACYRSAKINKAVFIN